MSKALRYWLTGVAVVALAFGVATVAFAQAFTEGKHYTRVSAVADVQLPKGKVEVREFFWYRCPHCYTLEPYIQNWDRPKSVEFVTMPALLGKDWVDHAYAYYALKTLGQLEKLHPVLFDAIHGKKRHLFTLEQIGKFVESHGVAREKFDEAVKSFAVDTQIKRAERLGKVYGINSVPTFVVNGKYVTSPSMAGSYENFFKVVDYLVAQESR